MNDLRSTKNTAVAEEENRERERRKEVYKKAFLPAEQPAAGQPS